MKNKFMKMNKFTDRYIYDKHLIYILIFLMSLMMPTIFLLYKGEMWDVSKTLIYSIETILGIVNLDLIIFNLIKRECKLEHVFLNLMIPVGCCYLVLIIPNYVYDEAAHSYRAYVISEGHIITDRQSDNKPKMEVPKDLIDSINVHTYKQLVEAINKKTDYNNLVLVGDDGVGATGYPFVCYIFSSIGMLIGRILNLNIIIAYYLAKILSFISFLILSFYTLKKLPIGKIIMFVYLFNPMLIHQIISISADSLIISFCLLFVCYILNLLYNKEKLTNKKFLLLSFLTICVAMGKYVYIPLVLLLMLLTKDETSKNKRRLLTLFISSIVLCIGLYFYVNILNPAPASLYIIENNVDSLKQLKNVIMHPTIFFEMFYRTILQLGPYYLETFLGSSLGWLNIYVNKLIIYSYLILLCLSPFLVKEKKYPDIKLKLSFLFITIITSMLVIFGLYLGWTPVGALVALGIQGRYFIPIAFMILLAFSSCRLASTCLFLFPICIKLRLYNISNVHIKKEKSINISFDFSKIMECIYYKKNTYNSNSTFINSNRFNYCFTVFSYLNFI